MFRTQHQRDTLEHEARIALHVERRDFWKRAASTLMVFSLAYWTTSGEYLFAALLAIAACEMVLVVVGRRLDRSDGPAPLWLLVLFVANNVVSVAAYLIPSLVLAGHGSVPLLLAGYLWMFGVFVHATNSFVAIPYFNWPQMAAGFVMAIGLVWVAARTGYSTGPDWEWLVLAALVLVYFANTLETLTKQKDTQSALDSARAEANARLRALEHMTRHDALTGLLNRRAFDDRLGQMLADRPGGAQVAVFLIDLDGFKPINDTYSHRAGDAVLCAVAHRLAAIDGGFGIVARLGGDEFAVALPDIGSDRAALRIGRQMLRDIAQPIGWEEKQLRIGASIGIGIADSPQASVLSVCADADQAMYRAKADRSGEAVIFSRQSFAPRLSLEDRARLTDALRQGEIRPHYQPIVWLDSGAVCGFEALARWHHPDKGLLLPAVFLGQINELGLQGDFLEVMARQVLADISALTRAGLDPGRVSINVPEIAIATHSGRADLDRILQQFPDAVSHLTLEITEDVFIARSSEMIQASIAHFRQGGLKVSLDDFGTGFASFHHLRQLDFDELKVDPSFVSDLGRDRTAEVLMDGFLGIASGLGKRVIAEGVETESQRRDLLQMGCIFGQGFLFGRAMPLDEIRIRLIAESSRVLRPFDRASGAH